MIFTTRKLSQRPRTCLPIRHSIPIAQSCPTPSLVELLLENGWITTVDLSNVRQNPHDLARMVRPKSNRAQKRSSLFTVSLAQFQSPGTRSGNCPSIQAINRDVTALTSIETPKTREDGCQRPPPVSSHSVVKLSLRTSSLLGQFQP